MDKKTTKERILETAIDLFSENGYDGVGVDEIAESIGMKGPSLYRHFKGKEAILDAVISIGEERYEENFGSADKLNYVPESMDKLIETSLQQINFTMHDLPKSIARSRSEIWISAQRAELIYLCINHSHH